MTQRTTSDAAPQTRRADALRNIERILDATIDELARDQEASMEAIARRAGVVRATLYVHFPTREALIAAVTDRAIAEAADAIRAANPDQGEPVDALVRVLKAAWRTVGRYHPLVAINARLAPERMHELHDPVLSLVRQVLERGRASSAFDSDQPLDWMLTVVLELIHAASRQLSAGRLSEDVAERALVTSVVGALSPARSATRRRRPRTPPRKSD